MNVIAVIPARGGSKSILKKNIKPLSGKPLIEYTIEAALESKVIDCLIVSTDDDEISDVCGQYKDIEIIKRPKEISLDESRTESCLVHACEKIIELKKIKPDLILTLEPTSPLRKPDTIKKSVQIFNENTFDSLISVIETKDCLGKIKNGKFEHLEPKQPRRRQDRKGLYKECGVIYATRYKTLIERNSIFGLNTYPMIVGQIESLDINYESDFKIIEAIIKNSGK